MFRLVFYPLISANGLRKANIIRYQSIIYHYSHTPFYDLKNNLIYFAFCLAYIKSIRIFDSSKRKEIMKNFKAIVTENTAHNVGQVIANTKSPGQYKGMSLEQFTEATKGISAFTISIIEM